MIKRAQKQFIFFTELILLIMFILIFGVECVLMQNANTKSINNMVNDLELSYTINGASPLPSNSLIVEMDTVYFGSPSPTYTCRYDGDVFNESKVKQIVQTIMQKDYVNVGTIENLHYHVLINAQKTVIFAVDGSFMQAVYRSNVISNLITLIVVYAILSGIVVSLSYKIFKPIRESFDKQRQFISDASHELKTPISVIKANAEIIKQDNPSQWINNVSDQTDRLGTLVADMLTLTKIREDKVDLIKENINLSELLLENVLPFEAVAFENSKSIITDVEEDLYINLNRKSVTHIISILVDNAIKHSLENSDIVVSLKRDGKRAVLTVLNQGSEVPNGKEAVMFERFYRADDSRSRDSGGSGLGLAIAKHLADANKWKIYASSEYKKSMCITVVF